MNNSTEILQFDVLTACRSACFFLSHFIGLHLPGRLFCVCIASNSIDFVFWIIHSTEKCANCQFVLEMVFSTEMHSRSVSAVLCMHILNLNTSENVVRGRAIVDALNNIYRINKCIEMNVCACAVQPSSIRCIQWQILNCSRANIFFIEIKWFGTLQPVNCATIILFV